MLVTRQNSVDRLLETQRHHPVLTVSEEDDHAKIQETPNVLWHEKASRRCRYKISLQSATLMIIRSP
jgi:hypothetical protein